MPSKLSNFTRLYLRRGGLSSLLRLADLETCYLRNKQACIIFQMGKVGSTSLIHSLNATGQVRAFQAHRLNPETMAEIRSRFLDGENYYRDMIFERGVLSWMRRQNRSVKVIVPIREPFSHTYSAFFQNISRNTRGSVDPEAANVDLLASYFSEWEELGLATKWIDREYVPVLGHSPYNEEFDHDSGVKVISRNGFDVLLMKIEIDDAKKVRAISSFLGIDCLSLRRENVAHSKAYGEIYDEFRTRVKISRETAERWSQSRYMRHFYTTAEADAALERYSEI